MAINWNEHFENTVSRAARAKTEIEQATQRAISEVFHGNYDPTKSMEQNFREIQMTLTDVDKAKAMETINAIGLIDGFSVNRMSEDFGSLTQNIVDAIETKEAELKSIVEYFNEYKKQVADEYLSILKETNEKIAEYGEDKYKKDKVQIESLTKEIETLESELNGTDDLVKRTEIKEKIALLNGQLSKIKTPKYEEMGKLIETREKLTPKFEKETAIINKKAEEINATIANMNETKKQYTEKCEKTLKNFEELGIKGTTYLSLTNKDLQPVNGDLETKEPVLEPEPVKEEPVLEPEPVKEEPVQKTEPVTEEVVGATDDAILSATKRGGRQTASIYNSEPENVDVPTQEQTQAARVTSLNADESYENVITFLNEVSKNNVPLEEKFDYLNTNYETMLNQIENLRNSKLLSKEEKKELKQAHNNFTKNLKTQFNSAMKQDGMKETDFNNLLQRYSIDKDTGKTLFRAIKFGHLLQGFAGLRVNDIKLLKNATQEMQEKTYASKELMYNNPTYRYLLQQAKLASISSGIRDLSTKKIAGMITIGGYAKNKVNSINQIASLFCENPLEIRKVVLDKKTRKELDARLKTENKPLPAPTEKSKDLVDHDENSIEALEEWASQLINDKTDPANKFADELNIAVFPKDRIEKQMDDEQEVVAVPKVRATSRKSKGRDKENFLY